MAEDDGAERPSGVDKRVFSLWPVPQTVSLSAGAELPAWARETARAAPDRRPDLTLTVVTGAVILSGVSLVVAVVSRDALSPLWLALTCLSATAFWSLIRRRGHEQGEARWRDALFERSGISLWREDWSPVGEAILKLKRAGVHDIQAHFAARPDEARALRSRVMIKDVNAFTVQMMGGRSRADFIGSLDRILPDSDQTFDQWLIAFGRGDAFYRSETHIVRPDGSHLDCLFTASLPTTLAGFRDILVTALDVTDYKAMQTRLVAAETEAARALRISTLGALTASIAHEVNTPLASILANVQAGLRWLRRETPNLEEAERALDRAIADASRAYEVVARTRDFLSGSAPVEQPVDLAETARVATVLIDRELRSHDASVHLDAPTGLSRVLADPIQMQQVLLNLLINGVQAMKDQPAPRDLGVVIREADGQVRVTITDRGPGVPETERARLFEPFFSSRAGGMGMGLAICRTCVESHGGRIWLDEAATAGAVFHLSLPAIRDQA